MRMRMLEEFDLSPLQLSGFLMHVREQAGQFVESCVDHIVSISPRVLGFSLMFCQVCASLAVARRVKERLGANGLKVVFGGSDCEGIMGYTMLKAFPCIDYVCCGEGERAFIELANHLLEGNEPPQIQGIVGRNHSISDEFSTPAPIRNMNELPFPEFEDYFAAFHTLSLDAILTPLLPIETSRGCWWGERSHCTFCGLNGLTIAYRSKAPERVINEFDYLAKKHGPLPFYPVDNILDLSFFKSVFPEIIRKGLRLDLFFETKSNLRQEDIRLLRDAGVLHIQAGIENLSDDTLRLMRKGVTGLQNVLLLKRCRQMDIRVKWIWLWGFPNEKPSEYKRMEDWIPLLHHMEPPGSFARIHLDRFSPLFESQKVYGISNVVASFPYRLIYPLEEKTLDDLAYYFDYDYEDGRNPEQYTAGLADEIMKWRNLWNRSSSRPVLDMSDTQRSITIHDTRPCAIEDVIVLTGLEADIYRQLTSIRERNVLVRHLVELGFIESDILQAIAALMKKRLVLVDTNRCLALAVDVSSPQN
jgi:ribosomal peptide maturation radical SAM protein 1